MRKLLFSALFCLSLGLPNSIQAQKAENPKFIGNIEGVKEYTLNNGMKVLLIPDASQSNMVVNIVYLSLIHI